MERRFLGWTRPALHSVADFLIERWGDETRLDLADVIVVVPGARAGRRLIELLVERCEDGGGGGLDLVPPAIVTARALPERLVEPRRRPPLAGEMLELLAWARALREAEPSLVARITAALPEADDLGAWLALGETLRRVRAELAGEGLEARDVIERASAEDVEGFADGERWRALCALEERYLAVLSASGRVDPESWRLALARRGEGLRDRVHVVLACLSEVRGLLRSLLDRLGAARVTALVFAPEEMAERFDASGSVDVRAWSDASIDIDPGSIVLADRPADQAAAALRAIEALDGRRAAGDIVIGAPDEEVVPYLDDRMARCGLPLHPAAGVPLESTAPYRLVEAFTAYIETRGFRELAALLRHPDVEPWLDARPAGAAGGRSRAGARARPPAVRRGRARRSPPRDHSGARPPRDRLSLLDRYLADHLQETAVAGAWLGRRNMTSLREAHRAIDDAAGELLGPPRPLREWAEPIVRLLLEVYDHRPFDRDRPDDRRSLEVFEAIRAAVEEVADTEEGIAASFSAAEALRLVLRRLGGASIPQAPVEASIEVLGWLELPLDDAPVAIITGLDDAVVPGSAGSDPLLPNALRRRLGLLDDDRRRARDAYHLSAVIASREEVKLIVGRRGADSRPLRPSRLLFACPRRELLDRVRALFPDAEPGGGPVADGAPAPGELAPGEVSLRFPVPPPRPSAAPACLTVTSFRDYLTCPYGFYLRHVLRLETLDDRQEELDARGFGILAHAVLQDFAREELDALSDAALLARRLDALLDRAARERYGSSPLPAVRVQVEQLRARLHAFAAWQAEWASSGWRIEHAELEFDVEAGARLDVDGAPVLLRGRIDRVDRNESTGERIVFDYKSSEKALGPEAAHRSGGDWVDLQLPLYRHLVRAAPLGLADVRLGYIGLPREAAGSGARIAAWTAGDLASADEKARWVVRRIREGAFEPAPRRRHGAFSDYAVIYQEGLIGAEGELAVAAPAEPGDEEDAP